VAEEPEQRMLFDLRGRRKRVIQVIYVFLALIMVASLVVIGLPGGISPFNSGTSVVGEDAAELSINRAENLEQRLKAEPNNENLQKEIVRARIAAGGSLFERDDETGQIAITEEAAEQYELAAAGWERYLKQFGDDPDPQLAQVVTGTLYQLAEGSTVAQFENNIAAAARAQEIVVEAAEEQAKKGEGAPPVAQLASLAELQYLAQNTKAAEAAADRALALADDSERKQLKTQLNSFKQNGKRVGKQLNAAKKQAKQDGGKSLQDPAGSLGSQDSLGTGTTTP
jgi:hypothetical protein